MVLAITTFLGIFSIMQLSYVNNTGTEMARNWLPSVQALAGVRYNISRIRSNTLQHILSETPEEFAEYDKTIADLEQTLLDRQKQFAALIEGSEERKLYDEYLAINKTYFAEQAKMLELSRTQQDEEALKLVRGPMRQAFGLMESKVNEIFKLQEEGAAQTSAYGDALYDSARRWIIALLVGSIAIGFAFALWLANLIARSIRDAVFVAQTVASGDLTARITVDSKDETGQLMQALKTMNDSLIGIVSEVRTATDSIASASGQISSGSLDLSSRTEEQASSLEETAASMEELTSTVRHNADNARQANQLAHTASQVAGKGGQVVSQVVDTMDAIHTSSKKIVDIISVIDSIAFQTNILALNAAVEAARAGEQGRGFAVVASEVRTLAQRSAEAAKEIKTLIDDSVSKVDIGSQLVGEAGATMKEVVSSIQRVNDIVSEISAASVEQSSGIEQVNQAITQMDQVTQQNAALVEEASAAADSMQEQAKNLVKLVSTFKISTTQYTGSTAATYKPAPVQPNPAKPALVHTQRRAAIEPPRTQPAARAAASADEGWEQF